jgi:hypothetical protein
MITREQSLYAERRFGVTLATWLDAEDMDPAAAALARAVGAGLRRAMEMRSGLRRALRQHADDIAATREMLESGREITEDLPHRVAVADALKAIADLETTLEPVVAALYQAWDEPHP